MPPINSSEDVFFYAITIVVIAVGFFLSWTLYYMAQSFRDTRKITKDIRQRVETFWEMIELARDKLQVGGAVFKVAATGIKEVTDHLKAYTESDDKPKKKKKKDEDEE